MDELRAPDRTREGAQQYTLEWDLGGGDIATLTVRYGRGANGPRFTAHLGKIHRATEPGGITVTTFGLFSATRLADQPCATSRFSRRRLHEAVAAARADLAARVARGEDAVLARFTPDALPAAA